MSIAIQNQNQLRGFYQVIVLDTDAVALQKADSANHVSKTIFTINTL